MKHFAMSSLALMTAGLLASAPTLAADEDLRKEVENLKQQNQTILERLNATSEMLESSHTTSAQGGGVHIGGYGELHYNNWDNKLAGGTDKEEMDFHRFVLFFGHEFTSDIRFFSELEVEHALAGESQPGEVELEQAYVEFDLNDATRAKGGLFLMPVGILNETHEPPTFYGVERNPIESNIVPSTWWEAGAAVSGQFGEGWSYDLAVTSGLDLATANKVRDGRQKVAKARANSLMYTGRMKFTGIAGTELAATFATQDDYTQGQGTKNSATLIEAHGIYTHGPFGLRALYATWDLEGKTAGYDEQTGWFIEPSFRVNKQFGVFARYNEWDNQAGSDTDTEFSQVDVGVNYWPHADVVIKVDLQDQDAPAGSNEFDGFNLGIGYQF